MKLTTRQKFGIGLIALSVVVAAIIFWNSDRVVQEMHPGETSQTGIASLEIQTTVIVMPIHVRDLIPPILCAGAGSFCLLWPPRDAARKRQ